MALEFPLALADFFENLDLTESTLDLPESMVVTGRTGGGEVLTATSGVRLWEGDVVFMPQSYADADAILAKISILREPGRPFFVTHAARPAPRYDPTGAILGGAQPKISSVASNNRDLTIKDMPAGYVIAPGDHISWRYGINPDYRYAFHRVVQGGVASGGGTVTVEVTPYIRTGALPDLDIKLINPMLKAVLVPRTVDTGKYSGRLVTGIKFGWRQTLR